MGTRAIHKLSEKAGKQILRKFGNEEKCLFCSLMIMVDSVKRQIQEIWLGSSNCAIIL